MKMGKLKGGTWLLLFLCQAIAVSTAVFYGITALMYSWRGLFLPELDFSFAKFCAFAKLIVLFAFAFFLDARNKMPYINFMQGIVPVMCT